MRKVVIRVKTVSFVRLPVLILIGLSMILGTYMLPQRRGAQLTQGVGCTSTIVSNVDEEDPEGEEFLIASSELPLASLGRECSHLVATVPDSHVTDPSRRPPRARIA
jgi:hypothetical protein